MNRKNFLKNISILSAAGVFSGVLFETACSRGNNSANSTNLGSSGLGIAPGSRDTLSAKDTTSVADTVVGTVPDSLNPDLLGLPSKDSIDAKYPGRYPFLKDSPARARYCEIVAQNAEKLFPKCKPYLELILKSNYESRVIFDIPPEYHIAMLNRESEFDPDAVSSVSAIGIAQFMRGTARDAGLKVYDGRKYRELFQAEKKLTDLSEELNVIWNNSIPFALKNNDFKGIEKYKKKYDIVLIEHEKLLYTIKRTYLTELKGMEDERKIPSKAIPASANYYAQQGDACQKFFKGNHIHNVLRGAIAYDCGYGNVKKFKGLPFIPEPIYYVRDIMVNADKMAPRQPSILTYELNPLIMSESIANKRYYTDPQLNPQSALDSNISKILQLNPNNRTKN